MNLAIHQTSRKEHRSRSIPKLNKSDVVNMARSFGVDLSDSELDNQMENTWEMLNNLHETDPDSYNSYIFRQMEDMKDLCEKGTSEGYFVPEKGFVIKVFLKDDNFSKCASKKVFLNMCQHKAVEVPHDHGRKIENDEKNLNNLEIPIAISEVRQMKDRSGQQAMVIDVVVNPWCHQTASSNKIFKDQLIDLVLKSVQQEHDIHFQSRWKIIKSSYKGGTGIENADVHRFPVRTSSKSKDSNSTKGNENLLDTMSDPSTLIRSIHSQNDDDTFDLMNDEKGEVSPKRVLIEEVDPNERKTSDGKNESGERKRKAQSLSKTMKGFLNRDKDRKAIYKHPSSGDGEAGTGRSFTRLMSKCQVIDTAEVSISQKQSISKDSKVPFADVRNKEFLNHSNGLGFSETEKERGTFDAEFHEIVKRADPDFAQSFDNSSQEEILGEESFKALADLMTVDKNKTHSTNSNQSSSRRESSQLEYENSTSPKQSNKTTTTAVMKDVVDSNHHNFQESRSRSTVSEKNASGVKSLKCQTELKDDVLTVKIDLWNTQVEKLQDIDLETVNNKLTLKTSCGSYFECCHPVPGRNISAKFKKKKKILIVMFA